MTIGQVVCRYVILAWFGLATPSIVMAQSYDKELKDVATTLVAKLEAANQHSGTVLDFTDLQGSATELGRFLAQELSDQLVSAGKSVSFVDRANLRYLLRENKLSTEGLINPESSRKLGNLIGIDTILFGTVTPMGERSVRLSVRAVAVETGKIVVAQSVTLLMSDNLASMFTHGVTGTPASTDATDSSPRSPDVRSRFRADSIRVTASPATKGYASIGLTFTVENRSGMPIGLGVVTSSTSLGACPIMTLSGLKYLSDPEIQQLKSQPEPQKTLLYVPPNGRATAAATFGMCSITQNTTVDLSSSLIIAVGKEVFTWPANASVTVR